MTEHQKVSAPSSIETPAQRISDYKIGCLDKRGRRVLDILWATKEFVIFQHAGGISPHFSNDDDLSREQSRRYMRLGPKLSRINALLPPPRDAADVVRSTGTAWNFFNTPNEFLYRETARANVLAGDHQRAIDILAFVENRLIARRRAQGQFQYLLACTGMLVVIVGGAIFIVYCALLPKILWYDLMLVAACGAAGGFLSVAIGIRKLESTQIRSGG